MTNAFTRTALMGNLLQDPEIAHEFSGAVFIDRMLQFERAWTEALKTTGAVDEAAADIALQAMDAFAPDIDVLGRASEVDGLPVPELVRQLRAGLPEKAQAAIHTGATSQDVIDTSMILTACSVLNLFEWRARALLECLDDLATRFADNPIMGRTRMQAALPIMAGDRIEDWRTPLAAHFDQLPELIERISIVQVGGAVGLRATSGSCDENIATCVAELLKLRVFPVWHTDRSVMLDIGHWLTKITGTLGKVGQDIALMAQQGIDEIKLDGAGGSSSMPHKQNPIRAEILVASARVVAGHQGILAQSMIHEQERSGAAWAIEWMTLPAMFESTGASLNNADHLLRQIRQIGSGA
ncbi:3-carboxy-cis,cis-muconate cycloisomerase [Granulosicoccus antarcticus]|uniref:3-carboxy-cis,cis-muconate cycloisomerase n=1 Tax=Granulosicoccus antarcticus IMCC3135 TaxID=1192854 RepID=A0A2Z2NTX9_9GAMM|nr:3-carboxy-cis,cis-muconate cycloisomerase [Granulosicoccus antarcticus]ASJ73198.1 3-carboxy-cis,cis-muconate cycloisomerase [Granulosicoccus antarcticus IMCC3135]